MDRRIIQSEERISKIYANDLPQPLQIEGWCVQAKFSFPQLPRDIYLPSSAISSFLPCKNILSLLHRWITVRYHQVYYNFFIWQLHLLNRMIIMHLVCLSTCGTWHTELFTCFLEPQWLSVRLFLFPWFILPGAFVLLYYTLFIYDVFSLLFSHLPVFLSIDACREESRWRRLHCS